MSDRRYREGKEYVATNAVPEWFFIVRILHILAGATGLFIGPLAMLTVKGGLWHRRWGKIYVAAMTVVALTAVALSLYKNNQFLLVVAIFSFYLSFSGWRILRRKGGVEDRVGLPLPDLLVSVAGVGAGFWLIGTGIWLFTVGNLFGFVFLTFGAISSILAGGELRALWQVPPKGKWLGQHIGRMLGAYTATLTAFSAVNIHFLPGVLVWIWPTVIMLPLIAFTIRHYKKAPPTKIQDAPV